MKYPYIITPYQTAMEAGLITEKTTRRTNADRTKVILNAQDFATFRPMITVKETLAETGEETTTERYANTIEEKAQYLGAVIMSHEQILKEITKQEWLTKEE